MSLVVFRHLRNLILPIYGNEFRKVIPLVLIYFGIFLNYSVFRSLKDMLMIQYAGAESVYYLMLVGTIPGLFVFTVLYNRLVKRTSRDQRFNVVMLYFLVFAALYAFWLFPNEAALRWDTAADLFISRFPNLKHLGSCIRYWHMSLFYIHAEAWGTMVLSVLFWTFVNDITSLEQSKRVYAFLSVGAALGVMFSGFLLKYIHGHDMLMSVCIVVILSTIAMYNLMELDIKKKPECYKTTRKSNARRGPQVTFFHALKRVLATRYLRLISVLVICYGVAINLFEAVWNAKIKELTELYGGSGILSEIYGMQGILSGGLFLFIIFLLVPIMNRGWRFAASVTPAVMLCVALIFFGFLYFQNNLEPFSSFFKLPPLGIVVYFGMLSVAFIKPAKYTLFSITKEQTYIPLDEESKVCCKAIIDGVGARIGQGLGSMAIVLLFIPTMGSIDNAKYFIFAIIIFFLLWWLWSVSKLNVLFKNLTKKQ